MVNVTTVGLPGILLLWNGINFRSAQLLVLATDSSPATGCDFVCELSLSVGVGVTLALALEVVGASPPPFGQKHANPIWASPAG